MEMPPALYDVYEIELCSDREYDNALYDTTLTARFESPGGKTRQVDGFWDGGDRWLVRFSPDETGKWRWETSCADEGNAGLHGQSGEFECVASDDRFLAHGPLRIAADRTHLECAAGTPFLWLGDTAWNGVLRAREEDWNEYLALRREQGFTAIQFVCTQWRGWPDIEVFIPGERLRVNPEVFQAMDRKVAAINRHGLLAVPVMLWALKETDPGEILPEDQAVRLARYMVARWGAYSVVWMLGGDGRYPDVERWRRIGRAVFDEPRDRLVSLHVCGSKWVKDEFGGEPWFDFIGYQSGHGQPADTSRWITAGPPAQHWAEEPLMPVMNLEPNYEEHPAYGGGYTINDLDVRRAAYFSLLVTPPAGVTYGNNHIWSWNSELAPLPGHESLGQFGPWSEGLRLPGIANMTALRGLMNQVEWWRLRPAQELLIEQPGAEDPTVFIAVAATVERDLVLVYTPGGLPVRFRDEELPARARWFDPREGLWQDAAKEDSAFVCPDERDWALVLGG